MLCDFPGIVGKVNLEIMLSMVLPYALHCLQISDGAPVFCPSHQPRILLHVLSQGLTFASWIPQVY